MQRASRTARVNEITSSDVSQNNNKTEKSKKENPVVNEIREMKSEIVAAIRGSVDLLIKVLAVSVKLRLIRNQID